jgi:hypothetical protein
LVALREPAKAFGIAVFRSGQEAEQITICQGAKRFGAVAVVIQAVEELSSRYQNSPLLLAQLSRDLISFALTARRLRRFFSECSQTLNTRHPFERRTCEI